MKKGLCHIKVAFVAAVLCLAVGGESQEIPSARDATKGPAIVDVWGVEVLSLRLVSEGYMLDFRYRVLDAEKASPLFDRQFTPYLIDEKNGQKFFMVSSPKVGSLRTTRMPESGRNYFVIFGNPNRYLKKGDMVTVVIGDFKAEGLRVE